MSFRAERRRLRHTLRPGEQIVASDPLCTIDERPELTVLSHPVFVVTTMSAYLILSDEHAEVRRIDFDAVGALERTDNPKHGSVLKMTLRDGESLTFTYEPRAPRQATADLMTERFFGRVVKDTAAE